MVMATDDAADAGEADRAMVRAATLAALATPMRRWRVMLPRVMRWPIS